VRGGQVVAYFALASGAVNVLQLGGGRFRRNILTQYPSFCPRGSLSILAYQGQGLGRAMVLYAAKRLVIRRYDRISRHHCL